MKQFDFEDLEISPEIKTFKVFQVSKMPDLFLEVEFKYPKTPVWKGSEHCVCAWSCEFDFVE